VASQEPSREALLAAMQQRGIKLPNYDIVVATGRGGGAGSAALPVEALWPLLQNEGGITQVGFVSSGTCSCSASPFASADNCLARCRCQFIDATYLC